ncbi:exonuclease domain-containing protein [Marinifilum flexuosum]|uniref:exonuclease domain-containing protein n=1 Tax=Marinifilum flexuosum TaxID=1117708 RepID=UPI002494E404|nr:exonuclease domain-containing protein [Marinifilum flexuosum]
MNNSLTFTAIDFETAQGPRTSICQVGIVRVVNNVIAERYSILVQPPQNKYQQGNIGVHGITPEMTKDLDTFDKVWPKIKHFFDNQLLVAHNMSFDEDVLIKTLQYYNIDLPTYKTECTFEKLGKGLAELCEENKINLNHHDGLSDAEACAILYLKYHDLHSPKQDIRIKPRKSVWSKKWDNTQRITGDVLKPNLEGILNVDNPFYGKKVVVSGTYTEWPNRKDLAVLLKNYGADIDTSVTSRTNILCAGVGVGPKKLEKMQKNQADGRDAMILSEEEILEMLVDNEFDHQQ